MAVPGCCSISDQTGIDVEQIAAAPPLFLSSKRSGKKSRSTSSSLLTSSATLEIRNILANDLTHCVRVAPYPEVIDRSLSFALESLRQTGTRPWSFFGEAEIIDIGVSSK